MKANDNLWKFVSHINLTYFAKVASDYQRYGNIGIVDFQVRGHKIRQILFSAEPAKIGPNFSK